MASIISAGTTSATALNMSADTSGVLQLASNNGTVALTIGTNQNIGVANVNPSFPLDVGGAGQFSMYCRITNTGGTQRLLLGNQDSGGVNKPAIISSANSSISFGYGNTWSGDGGTFTNLFSINQSGTSNDFNAVLTGGTTLYPAFFPRAFVAVNQQGTQAIQSSGNISSIADGGTGLTTVNLSTFMPDTNYALVGGESGTGVISGTTIELNKVNSSQFGIRSLASTNAAAYDFPFVCAVLMR